MSDRQSQQNPAERDTPLKALRRVLNPAHFLSLARRAAVCLRERGAEALCRRMLKKPRVRQTPARPPLPCEVELSLREALGTEIRVQYKDGKGSLQVSFYSDEQLKAFANLLGKYEKERDGVC